MAIQIKFATEADEIDSLFRARHRVFVDEERALTPSGDGRLLDRFDAYPTTRNVIAVAEGHVIGGARFTEASAVGVPPAEYYDFSPHLPRGAGPIGSGSMLCVERAYRHATVAFYLLGMGYAWAVARGWSHIVGVVNPAAQGIFLGSGYRAVDMSLFSDAKQVPFVPVVLDLRDLAPQYRRFAHDHQDWCYWLGCDTPAAQTE